MYNYAFTIPSLLILCILLLYFFTRPRLYIRMTRSFLLILGSDVLTLFFDYVSSRVDEAYQLYPLPAAWILNLGFFVAFLLRIYCFFRFSLDVLDTQGRVSPRLRALSAVMFFFAELTALSSPFTHAVFYMDQAGYHRGPWYDVLYVCFFFYLFLSTVLILRKGKKLSGPERTALLSANLILLAGNIFRILLPKVLIMNTFCLMAILVLFLSFENPDIYLSGIGHSFNTKAFRMVLNEWYDHQSFRVLGMVIRRYNEKRGIYGSSRMDNVLLQIDQFLEETCPDALRFYLRNGSFAIAGPSDMDTARICEQIRERFRTHWISGESMFLLAPALAEVATEPGGYDPDRISNTLVAALGNIGYDFSQSETEMSDSPIQAIDRTLTNKQYLDQALDKDELEVFLQPLVNAVTGKLTAAEALVRIRDHDGNLILPGEFIPLAEKDGSIVLLGEQVLRKICRFLREHDPAVLGIEYINVNLSPLQCLHRDLPQRFAAILAEYDVPASMIHLELTEQLTQDYSSMKDQITALQELGFRFTLDDYGSGFSNLTRVSQYPFTSVKLDMEVVWSFCRQYNPLLPALVRGFREMGCNVTAEGIETKEMADAVTKIGCNFLQGFYFSRPIPMDDFVVKYSQAAAQV